MMIVERQLYSRRKKMSNLQPDQSKSDSRPRGEWRAWSHRDPAGRAMGGLVLIWLGVIFFIVQNGMFGVTWANMWGAFLMGLGGLLVLQALVRLVLPDYRRGVFGLVIGGMVLIAIGTIPFGGADWARWWPLALIALGIALLIQQFAGW
jgi:hypothetical protein